MQNDHRCEDEYCVLESNNVCPRQEWGKRSQNDPQVRYQTQKTAYDAGEIEVGKAEHCKNQSAHGSDHKSNQQRTHQETSDHFPNEPQSPMRPSVIFGLE